ncbi:MAG TPA: Dabb family protein, partial [Candidatus Merdenecus merdavium]|nr:Dabb family protein [Candidatus Merdenecus merdavium]
MVHHIVMWDFIDTLTQQEKDAAGEKIKKLLEDLKGKVEGLEKVEV